MLRFLVKRFASDRSGVSAVEFGLTVPVLLIALLGVIDLGNVVYQRGDLESALRSGIQYFMNGGSDVDKAEAVVNAAWTHRPEGATVTAEKYCLCGTTVSACNTLCGDGAYPLRYSRIVVDATFEGIISDNQYKSSQTVRVR